MDLARAEGPAARFRLTDESFASLSDPDAVHAVFNGSPDDYEKGELYQIVRGAFGESVFTIDGAGWAPLHAVFTPLLSRPRILALSPLIAELVENQLERWAQLPPGTPVDLLTESKRFAFDVVSRGLLGVPPGPEADELVAALGRIDRTESVRLFYLSKRIPGLSAAFRGTPLLTPIDRIVCGIAERRLSDPGVTDDLVDGAMASSYFAGLSTAQRLTFVRDLISSMLTNGYISSGESFFWAFYLLALHPAAQSAARQDSGSQYLTAVYQEALRLYPPAWFIGRVARKTVRVRSEEFAAGTRLVCSPFVLHRMSSIWPDPDTFRPERFLPGAAVAPRTHIPFGSGVRACIGRGLAMLEAAVLLPATLARFDLHLVSTAPVNLAGTFSMQPREPVLFRLAPR